MPLFNWRVLKIPIIVPLKSWILSRQRICVPMNYQKYDLPDMKNPTLVTIGVDIKDIPKEEFTFKPAHRPFLFYKNVLWKPLINRDGHIRLSSFRLLIVCERPFSSVFLLNNDFVRSLSLWAFRKIFVQKNLCSEKSLFRKIFIQKHLCSEKSLFF